MREKKAKIREYSVKTVAIELASSHAHDEEERDAGLCRGEKEGRI